MIEKITFSYTDEGRDRWSGTVETFIRSVSVTTADARQILSQINRQLASAEATEKANRQRKIEELEKRIADLRTCDQAETTLAEIEGEKT